MPCTCAVRAHVVSPHARPLAASPSVRLPVRDTLCSVSVRVSVMSSCHTHPDHTASYCQRELSMSLVFASRAHAARRAVQSLHSVPCRGSIGDSAQASAALKSDVGSPEGAQRDESSGQRGGAWSPSQRPDLDGRGQSRGTAHQNGTPQFNPSSHPILGHVQGLAICA
jgi:hypothetical protein